MIQQSIRVDQVKYDADHDVLHVFLGPYSPSFDDEDFPGIIVHRSAVDERITGITILDYSKIDSDVLRSALPLFDFSSVTVQSAGH